MSRTKTKDTPDGFLSLLSSFPETHIFLTYHAALFQSAAFFFNAIMI